MQNLVLLNERDNALQDRFARKVRVIQLRKLERREARALIAEAQRERDNLRGDMLRDFLK